ncbi:unnamed protein product [Rotaria sp. Silwood2]|nr:unnamed protein product [Rotaria sp. Silwood2]CAF2944493.1 unnamed protein product [Rotaria sp. Silwood2]CAF4617114.1 unnamed protein product [Rotaria sp. Silwood2]
MPYRSKILQHKCTKQEQELHIISNPLDSARKYSLASDNYLAPLTACKLKPNSKWIIVRNNIHKIRSWRAVDKSNIDKKLWDWYIFFQIRRELRHIQADIKQIEQRPDFVPVHHIEIPAGPTHTECVKVSHVRPTDVLYYPSFDPEPMSVQALIYYFSKERIVTYESVFHPLLSNVCSITNRDRERLRRVAVFRKLALVLGIVVFLIVGLMLASLILSVLETTSNLKNMYSNDPDGGIEWRAPSTTIEITKFNF